MNLSRSIAMPNEIFMDMKELLEDGTLKSPHHQEFLYSYYWIIAYSWRFAIYSKLKINQSTIKGLLGLNPNEKRINYIIKRGGVLDSICYTDSTKNFPIAWHKRRDKELSFSMLYELYGEDRSLITQHLSPNYTVKKPIKHTGDGYEDGLFWNSSNTHIMNGEHFKTCMENYNLGCSGFYLLGVLIFIRDKTGTDVFPCANSTLVTYTNWSERKIRDLTNEMVRAELISKTQERKSKGSVNKYQVSR